MPLHVIQRTKVPKKKKKKRKKDIHSAIKSKKNHIIKQGTALCATVIQNGVFQIIKTFIVYYIEQYVYA